MDKEIINIEDLIDKDNPKIKSKKNIAKFFSKKYIKIYILLIIAIVLFVMFLSMDKSNKSEKNTISTSKVYLSTIDYCSMIESKLESVLSKINGAGSIKVMVTLDGSPELVYAMDSDIKTSTNQNGSTATETSTPIIVQVNGSSEPLILTEKLPQVKGVIVVSSGASDVSIKLDILRAVSTLLDISTEKISVLKGI